MTAHKNMNGYISTICSPIGSPEQSITDNSENVYTPPPNSEEQIKSDDDDFDDLSQHQTVNIIEVRPTPKKKKRKRRRRYWLFGPRLK